MRRLWRELRRRATTRCSSPSGATSRSPRATAPTCRASSPPRARPRTPGWSRRSSAGWSTATPTASPPRSASGRTSRSASSPRWASRATSWWSPTSSTGPRTTASGSAPAAARAPARSWPTRMRITDLDPLVHGLLFERFLNPERVSMPDFDIDFDERRRGEVIRYVTDKYGDDRVSMIVTYGTIKAKQAVKDSSRILGYPFAMGDRITKAMPAAVMGKDIPLKDVFDPEHKRYGEGGEFRVALRQRRRRQEGGRHRHRDRGAQAPVGRARGRRDHVERAAGRRDPVLQAARRRRDDHPVRLPDVRDPRPDQDGLPGAAQPHRPRRRAEEHQGQPRRDAGARGPARSTTPRPTSCSAPATRSASSSSTAARCAPCCG